MKSSCQSKSILILIALLSITLNKSVDAFPRPKANKVKLNKHSFSNMNTRVNFGHQNVLQSAPTKKPVLTPASLIEQELVEDLSDRTTTILPSEEITTTFPPYENNFLDSSEFLSEIESGVGTQGYCGENMILFEDENNSTNIYCDCNFKTARIPLVFHAQSKSCYSIYDQAYCKRNEWLVFNQDLKPICTSRACKASKNQLNVPLNGKGPCVALNSASTYCDSMEIVKFAPESVVASCQRNTSFMLPRVLAPTASFNCPPGSYRSITGNCQTGWTW